MTDKTPRSGSNAQQQRGGWHKSSFTATQCVEIRFEGDLVRIRDSKYRRNPANDLRREPMITVTADHWRAFLDAVNGPVWTPGTGALLAERGPDETTILRTASDPTTVLRYTRGEWESFLAGVRAGELRSPGTGVPVGV